MTTPGTPPRAIDAIVDPELTLERGFVASLRWLVAEGDVRGVKRIAVELRALREALATLDETRHARDEYARRAAELDRELNAAIAILGPATAINGNGSLVQRLVRLREKLAEDSTSRQQLVLERDAWRAMCTLLTQTRARVHELLDDTERDRHHLAAEVAVLRDRLALLLVTHDTAQAEVSAAQQEASAARDELAQLRRQLAAWSVTVERALVELSGQAKALGGDGGQTPNSTEG
jgi:chromosome segregation ATPase